MNWFIRNRKVYIGPVTDTQASILKNYNLFKECGVSCSASPDKVEMYLTMPASTHIIKDLHSIRFEV